MPKREEKQSVNKDRALSVSKQGLINKSPKKPSRQEIERLLTLRTSTVETTLTSLNNQTLSKYTRAYKTHPTSNVPNLQEIRHDTSKSRRVVVETSKGYHNVNPEVLPVTPVKLVRTKPPTFISPGRTRYGLGHSKIKIAGQGDEEVSLHPLKPLLFSDGQSKPVLSEECRIHAVPLSYQNLGGSSRRIAPVNNKQAQGGYSANDLMKIQMDDFKRGLKEFGFDQSEIDEYAKTIQNTKHEHTHLFAAHFGTVQDLEKQKIHPQEPKATFVAPAFLNSEMMLAEKFVDFLLFTNYRDHGFRYNRASVEYSCKIDLIPNTTQAIHLTLEIRDLHTGMSFTQSWDKPYAVTDKPASAMYSTLLQLLKAGLSRKSVAGDLVEQARSKITYI